MGRLPQLLRCFSDLNLKATSLQETRISGHVECKTLNYFVVFSGNCANDINPREYGVGIAIHKDWINYVKHIEPVSNRTMWVYIENTVNFYHVAFSVYDPTNQADDSVKFSFWLKLKQRTIMLKDFIH